MKFRCLVLLLGVPFATLAADADTAFLTAREAFRVGDKPRLDRAAAQMNGHPLAVYAESYQVRMGMSGGNADEMRSFLQRNDGSYVAEKLRADWIRWFGKKAAWTEIVAEYPRLLAPEVDITCWQQQARLNLGDTRVLAEAAPLWETQLEVAEACRPVLDALVETRHFSEDDIWWRARRQMEANRSGGVRQTLNYLPDNRLPDAKALDALNKSAMAYLFRLPAGWQTTRAGREIAAFGIQRVAANDPIDAAAQLEKLQGQLQASEREWAWGQIGLQAARRHLPEALRWYARAGDSPLSEEASQWKVRAALRAHDWAVVRHTIERMGPELAARPEWIYWLGRAYEAGGRTTEAQALYGRIAGQPNFYGSLADEELGRPVMPPPSAAAPSAEEQQAARSHGGLQRALAFFRLDLRTEAVKEWNWSLRGMTDRQLLAAADLAKRHQIWDRAINTADKTRQEHDFSLRFLAPYGEQVRPAARDQALDDAWVYGLMRQESRFITSAKSNVGASGLMQLMPATAKWVAKKIGLRDYHPGKVNDTAVNVLLGTSYMRLVMESLDQHPVLASAAYNAGPGRARKWRADRPLEGAIYAETIPFSETRDYVKKVMSNAVFYSALFNGKPDSLKARLGTVGAKTADTPKDADLP